MMGDDALFNLRWDAQKSALLGSMASLYREEAFVDTTIVADNKIFKAHKLLLSASSSYLRSILESVPASQHAVICMPQVSSIDMGNLLRFIYEGQIKISRRSLRPFLATAKLLRIKGMDFELNEDIDMALLPPHHQARNTASTSPLSHRGVKHSSGAIDETISGSVNNNNINKSGDEGSNNNGPGGQSSSSSNEQRGNKDTVKDEQMEGDDEERKPRGEMDDDDKRENGEPGQERKGSIAGSPSPTLPQEKNNDNNNSAPNGDRPSSRSGCGGSVHSEMDMAVCSAGEESNQSNSMEPLQLISLSRLAAASAAAGGGGGGGSDSEHHSGALNLVDHHHSDQGHHHHHRRMMLDDNDRDDRDEMMSNGGAPDYDDDDDDDHHFSMSIQPEVSLRESDESYSVHSNHDRRASHSHQSSPHSGLEIKQVPNLLTTSAFAGLPASGMTMTPFATSSALHNLHALKSLNKLRPLIPKAAHQSSSAAAAASQFQSMSEGILLRMMRGEPPHLGHSTPVSGGSGSGSGNAGGGTSLKREPGGSSSSSSSVLSHHASSFFDLGHGDTSHHQGGAVGAGLRKQKRYVQCTSCSKVLSSLSALKRHMEDVHCARIQGKCLLCGRVYSSRNSLLTHVYSAHKKHHDYKAVARIIRESDFEQFATA